MWLLIHAGINRGQCMYQSGELLMHSLKYYFDVFFRSYEAMRELNIKITLEWVHKQFAMTIHTSFYFLHDMINPYDIMMMKIWY